MPNENARLMAFFAVVLALLNSGLHFHRGDVAATLYFLIGAALVTLVTHWNVKKQLI